MQDATKSKRRTDQAPSANTSSRHSSSKSSTTFPFSCVHLSFSFLTLGLSLTLTPGSALTPPRSLAFSASRRAILARNLPPSSSSSEDSGRVSSIFLRFCFFLAAVAEEELARDPAPGVGEAEVDGTRSFAAGTGSGASSAVPE